MDTLLRLSPQHVDFGGGLSVRRLLPHRDQRGVGPFVFLDHFGPTVFPPGKGMDVRPHPHIGLATVTYLFEGAIEHRDSLGVVALIRPGEVNLMTAGSGVVHSERSPKAGRSQGQRLHGLQIWLALPIAQEESEPRFEHYDTMQLPQFERGGAQLRLIAGAAFGASSPVRVASSMFYLDVQMAAGNHFVLEPEYPERAVYVLEGSVRVSSATIAEILPAGALAVLSPDIPMTLTSEGATRLMLFGGEPLGHRFLWWNFVSSRKERIEHAKDDWARQRFGDVPGETEYIPLPPN